MFEKENKKRQKNSSDHGSILWNYLFLFSRSLLFIVRFTWAGLACSPAPCPEYCAGCCSERQGSPEPGQLFHITITIMVCQKVVSTAHHHKERNWTLLLGGGNLLVFIVHYLLVHWSKILVRCRVSTEFRSFRIPSEFRTFGISRKFDGNLRNSAKFR